MLSRSSSSFPEQTAFPKFLQFQITLSEAQHLCQSLEWFHVVVMNLCFKLQRCPSEASFYCSHLTNFSLTEDRTHVGLFYHRNIGGNKISIIFSLFFYFLYWPKMSLLAHLGSWQSAMYFLIHIFMKFEMMVVSISVALCFCRSTMLEKKRIKNIWKAMWTNERAKAYEKC